MLVVQNLPAQFIASLTTTGGAPATGLLPAAVTCQYRRAGDLVFTSKVLDNTNFVELGNGLYAITFLGIPDLGNIGPFLFLLTGVGIQQFASIDNQVVSSIPVPTSVPATPPTCVITAHVNDLSGQPVAGVAVSARVLGMPTIEGAMGLADGAITATTDDNGVFFLSIVRLATVEVVIPKLNYRRQFVVPNQPTVDLFSGIP